MYCMRDISNKSKTQKLESNHFSNALNDLKCVFLAPNYNCLCGLVVSELDSYLVQRVRAPVELFFVRQFCYLFSRIVLI